MKKKWLSLLSLISCGVMLVGCSGRTISLDFDKDNLDNIEYTVSYEVNSSDLMDTSQEYDEEALYEKVKEQFEEDSDLNIFVNNNLNESVYSTKIIDTTSVRYEGTADDVKELFDIDTSDSGMVGELVTNIKYLGDIPSDFSTLELNLYFNGKITQILVDNNNVENNYSVVNGDYKSTVNWKPSEERRKIKILWESK